MITIIVQMGVLIFYFTFLNANIVARINVPMLNPIIGGAKINPKVLMYLNSGIESLAD